MIVLDTFAWFEYFDGTVSGKRVGQLLLSKRPIATPSVCLAEFKRKCARTGRPWQSQIEFICSKSQVIGISQSIALRAGDWLDLHFSDALVYATALESNGTLVTGDRHFEGLPQVELLVPA